MRAAWPQATRLRLLRRTFATWSSAVATTTWTAVASSTAAAAIASTSFVARTVAAAAIAAAPIVAGAVAASTTTVAAASFVVTASSTASTISTTASTPVAVAAISSVATPALADQLRGDTAFVLARPEYFEGLLFDALRLRRQHVGDEHTIDGKLGVDAYDIANRGSFIQEGTIEVTLGLLGTGLSPGVRTVFAFTGELDFEASRHKGLR